MGRRREDGLGGSERGARTERFFTVPLSVALSLLLSLFLSI